MKKTVLVADDDPAIVDAIQIMLEDEGYCVYTSLGNNSVHMIKKIKPDIVLLDIWMSGQDGREIAKLLKNHPLTRTIPIIMISASRDIHQSALSSGADDFLEKPFEISNLLTLINKHLKPKQFISNTQAQSMRNTLLTP